MSIHSWWVQVLIFIEYFILGNQTTRNKWMFPQTAISYVKDFNCHIGTTVCFWLFGFPGLYDQLHPCRIRTGPASFSPSKRRGRDRTSLETQGETWGPVTKPYMSCEPGDVTCDPTDEILGTPNERVLHGTSETQSQFRGSRPCHDWNN